jgi:UDP-glucose 4-epimerase
VFTDAASDAPDAAPDEERTVKIVITGASGNVGTGLLRCLAAAPGHTVVGICRRPPPQEPPYDVARWVAADVTAPDAAGVLAEAFRGADAVVHLAWAIEPSLAHDLLARVNVEGTRAVLAAAGAAGVGHVVLASSVGVYSPAAGSDPVDERWPCGGIDGSLYSAQKVAIEAELDRFADEHADVAVARIRPALVVQGGAAREFVRYFLGFLVPRPLLRAAHRGLLPVVPLPAGLQVQLVHADDLGDAFLRVLERRATGAFNIAADAAGTAGLARIAGARPLPVPARVVAAVVALLDRARLVRLTPGWFAMLMQKPLVRTDRARDELGWAWTHSTYDCGREVLAGLARDTAGTSPVLQERPRPFRA